MKISNWLKQLSEDQASKYLCWYSGFFAAVYLLSAVLSRVIEYENGFYGNVVASFIWSLVWWDSRKREFKAVYFITIFWVILQLILKIYLLYDASLSHPEWHFRYSQYEIVAAIIFGTLIWTFPLLVSNEVKNRATSSDTCSNSRVPEKLDSKDISPDYSLFKLSTAGMMRKHPIAARVTPHPPKSENFATDPTQQTAKPTKEQLVRDINEKYRTGWLAIQFRDDAKQGWKKVEKLPLHQKLHYLKSLSDDPKREVESLVHDLLETHRKTTEPFNNEVLNSCFKELISVSPEAAGEFKHIVDALGDTVDPIKVKDIISHRRGKVGRGLIEYASSVQISLDRRWLPDQKFQNLFADEFEEFVRDKSLGDIKEKDAWCLFIEEMYARCNWSPPNPKR